MRSKSSIFLSILTALLLLPCLDCKAQFKSEAFSQNFNNDEAAPADSTDKIFSVKDYWNGLTHKQETDLFTMFEGSAVLVGGLQIYNKDYWKLPIVYGGLAAGVGSGIYLNATGNHDAAKYAFLGAGLVYWGSLLDGVISYKPDDYPSPAKATFYSLLVPGLGQIYNREAWKLPVYWGVMIGGLHYHILYKKNFERFRNIYNNSDTSYMSLETSKYYKNLYRRYRDYATLAIFAGYLIQVIDANVFAYMHNFEISDDLTMDLSPTIIAPDNAYAFSPSAPAFGLSIGFKF